MSPIAAVQATSTPHLAYNCIHNKNPAARLPLHRRRVGFRIQNCSAIWKLVRPIKRISPIAPEEESRRADRAKGVAEDVLLRVPYVALRAEERRTRLPSVDHRVPPLDKLPDSGHCDSGHDGEERGKACGLQPVLAEEELGERKREPSDRKMRDAVVGIAHEFIAVFLSLAIGNIVIGNTSTLATFPFRLPHKALQLTDHVHRKRQERISTFAAKAVGGLSIWKQRRLVHIEADGKITFLLVQEEVQRLEATRRATLYLNRYDVAPHLDDVIDLS